MNLTKLNTRNNARLFERFISAHCEMPTQGIVAGGAVNAFVMKLVLGIDAPVNDIDVFRVIPWYDYEANPGTKLMMPLRFAEFGTMVDEFYGMMRLSEIKKALYHVRTTSRDGLLNTVWVSPLHPSQKVTASHIISGFDINCCQVAYDITSQEFVWTDSYAAFLKSMQLEIVGLWTPCQSLIRLVRKQGELKGSYLNLEDQVKMVSAFVGIKRKQEITSRRLSLSYSRETLPVEDIDRNPKELTFRFGNGMMEKFLATERLFPSDIKLIGISDRLFTLDFGQIGQNEVGALETIINNRFSDSLLRPSSFPTVWSRGASCLTSKVSKRDFFASIDTVDGRIILSHKVYSLPKFASRNDITVLKAACKLCSEHNVERHFSTTKTAAEVGRTIDIFKALAAEFGLSAWGYIENAPDHIDFSDIEVARGYISSILKEKNTELIGKFSLNGFEFADIVTQLTTENELKHEGDDIMHHCVGGYGSLVHNGHVVIFHLDGDFNDRRGSTIDLRFRRDGKLYVYQHKAAYNKRPTHKNLYVGCMLCAFLNEVYFEGKPLPLRNEQLPGGVCPEGAAF